jgi:ribosomal protein S18 acetylase RimI-like enzyme
MENDDFAIDIKEATESDAEKILEIQKLAFHGQGILYNDFMLPPLVQTLEELVRDFRTYVLLKAVSDGKIVGSVRGRCESDTCFISRLIVHPDHQNRGIGKKLMLAIENKFSSARRYELFTGHKSEKNLALYTRLGYREFARKPQSANVTLICLEKRKT